VRSQFLWLPGLLVLIILFFIPIYSKSSSAIKVEPESQEELLSAARNAQVSEKALLSILWAIDNLNWRPTSGIRVTKNFTEKKFLDNESQIIETHSLNDGNIFVLKNGKPYEIIPPK